MTPEYIAILKNISDRSGFFVAVNVYMIKYKIADTFDNRVEVGKLLKSAFAEMETK